MTHSDLRMASRRWTSRSPPHSDSFAVRSPVRDGEASFCSARRTLLGIKLSDPSYPSSGSVVVMVEQGGRSA